jgi:O-antigen/teichoic acid export membrane protein
MRSDNFTSEGKNRHLIDLFLLFTSKSGVMIVGILILPIFHRILGSNDFGVVAVILSLQAFALIADFGMATLVGRDISHYQNSLKGFATLRDAKIVVNIFYGGGLVIGLFVILLTSALTSKIHIFVGCSLLFLLSVLQNIEFSAILARKHYIVASVTQIIGVLGRALLTVAALVYVSKSLFVFIIAQVVGIALQLYMTSFCRRRVIPQSSLSITGEASLFGVHDLISRGLPLMFAGLAGAAVLQLDKPILSAFVSSSDIAPYFLAMSFSAIPATLLAGPIAQYFQPKLIEAMTEVSNSNQLERIVQNFTAVLLLIVGIPSFIIWQLAETIISVWLHTDARLQLIVHSRAQINVFIDFRNISMVKLIFQYSRFEGN